jgi:hypothetical protein
MWDYFEEALTVYKEECSNHKEMYRGITECIERMEDEEASGSLMAALNYVFKDKLGYLQEPYKKFIY